MNRNERLLRCGAAILIVAAAVLFAPLFVEVPYAGVALAVSVLGAYAGAVLVGLSEEGRPV